jgi:hypothetical protein
MDSFVFDFQVRKLETFIKTNSADFEECDILYSYALYPQDGEKAETLLEKLNSFSKGDINEKNTDS